ncbi:hypothetical protein Tco_0044571 [Tanacetum coccineum]|uniref:Uncharacterized protein n=1 Tax=Tanacetum coccineum TaxID=301880 RepID=A0ABQ4YN18_9ASTR
MSTQQDIYAAGSENRPPMFNKDNYVPWSSRLLCYAKSIPNGKLIYNFIMNGPYVRRMIFKPGDPYRKLMIKPFRLFSWKIHAVVDSSKTAQEIWLRVRQMMKGSDIRIQEKKAKLFNEWEMFTSTDGKLTEQYAGQNVRNQNGYNAVQNVRNQVVQNAVQNLGVQNVGNQNGLLVVLRIANQNVNQNGNSNVVAARAEGNGNGNNENQAVAWDIDELEEVNASYILKANLQQASTSGTLTDKALVYDSDGSAEVHHYDNCYNNDIFNIFIQEEQYIEILDPITKPHMIQQNNSNVIYVESSVEHNRGTVEHHLATVEEIRAYFESLYNNLAIKVEKVNSVNRKMKETNVELTTELARNKDEEKCFEINQEKYNKLERCYQKSVYQEQCLIK